MGIIAPERKAAKSSNAPGFVIMLLFVVGIPLLAIHGVMSSSKKDVSEKRAAVENTVPAVSYSYEDTAAAFETQNFSRSYLKDKNGLYELTGPVVDAANLLSDSEYNSLSTFLSKLSRDTGVQIAVLTVPDMGGSDIESFSMEHAEKWKLGQKGKDNGALLTVAMDEHAVRIETGYGTEASLTDAKSSRLIRNVVVPAFKKGNYSEGIIECARSMAGIITSDPELVSAAVSKDSSSDEHSEMPVPVLLFMIVFFGIYISLFVYAVTRSKRRRRGHFTVIPPFVPPVFRSGNRGGFSGGFSGGHGRFSGGGGGFGGGGSSGSW